MSVKIQAIGNAIISLAEAKTYLRVDHCEEDALLQQLIAMAQKMVMDETGLGLGEVEVTEVKDTWQACCGEVVLRYGPISDAEGATVTVQYYNEAGTLTTLPSEAYQIDHFGRPGRLVIAPGGTWPTLQTGRINAVKIVYRIGSGSTAPVIQPLRQAMYLLIGYYYENREDAPLREEAAHYQRAWKALCQPYKVFFI